MNFGKPAQLITLTYLLFSCGSKLESSVTTPKPVLEVKVASDTIIGEPHVVSNSAFNQLQEIDSTTVDMSVADYFEEVYQQGIFIPARQYLTFSITDSLFSQNKEKRPFYFAVFTKSMNGANGYYAEALGISAYNYIASQPEQFAAQFTASNKLNENDLSNWANAVFGEIEISRQTHEALAVREIETELRHNMKGARKEYLAVVEQFLAELNNKVRSTS